MGVLMEVMDRISGGEISTLQEAVAEFGVQLSNEVGQNQFLMEKLAELELSLEDQGWTKLGDSSDKQFSRAALKTINSTARLYWLKNPLIKRAVYTQTVYVFGQGLTVKAQDEAIQEVLDKFMDDPKNQTELTSHQARMMKETELQLLANLFFVFFVNPSTGAVRMRTVPDDQIDRVIHNPEDSKEPWYYLRTWDEPMSAGSSETVHRSALYPDYRYNPRGGHKSRMDIDGASTQILSYPIYHIKVNCLSDMDFGVSEIYAAMDWAKAYKEFLEDWAKLVKSLSRFAWKATSKTGKTGINAIKDRLNTTVNTGNQVEGNPPPAVGSILATGAGLDVSPIAKTGATTSVDDGRRMLLMVSAATGIFEHYFGDPSTGNLATASAMERPMELMFKDRQTLWTDILVDILQFVVDQSVIAPSGAIKGTISFNDYGEREILAAESFDRSIEITFPDILEKDVSEKVDAIVKATTLGGTAPAGTIDLPLVTRMLLTALGTQDVEAVIERLFPGREDQTWDDINEEQTAKLIANQKLMAPPAPDSADEDMPPKPGEPEDDTEDTKEALEDSGVSPAFLKAVRKLDSELAEILKED